MRNLLVILFLFYHIVNSYGQESIGDLCYQQTFKQGDYQDAIDTCQKAIALNPGDLRLYQALGGSYFQLKDYEKAIESYQQVIALGPTNPHYIWHANNMIAKAYGYLYNFEAAVEYFRKANAAEDNVESHMNLAATLRHMKRLDEAKVEYYKALDIARAKNDDQDVDFLEQEIKKYGF